MIENWAITVKNTNNLTLDNNFSAAKINSLFDSYSIYIQPSTCCSALELNRTNLPIIWSNIHFRWTTFTAAVETINKTSIL